MYHTILFDLDGTLTDPGLGITNSVMYALRQYGIDIPESDRASLYSFIGPPLTESFSRFFGFSDEKARQAVEYYRAYFGVKGLYENTVYDGIPELLRALRTAGKRILLATSKPEVYAVAILKHFGLYDFFDFAAGATLDASRIRKADVIAYALECCGITDGEKPGLLMVGDRAHDVLGAREVGLDSVGVTFGYGSRAELVSAGATYIADSPAEVLTYARL